MQWFCWHSGESDGDSGGGEVGDQALGLMEQGGWKRGADCFDDHAIHVLMVLMFYYCMLAMVMMVMISKKVHDGTLISSTSLLFTFPGGESENK